LIALETAFLASAQRVGVLRDDLPPEWIEHVLFGLLVAARDAQRYGTVAPRLLVDLVHDSMLRGVAR
ncbi:MAG: TetR/AcrR family transcriptional regulator, partial [Solirubrobacteraceae bacterium]